MCRQCKVNECGHHRSGRKRALTFTREYQQRARACVKRESLQRSGARGFKALVEKRGFEAAAEHVAQWRRAHPSRPMQIVGSWLDELGAEYLMDEHLRDGVYPDFVIAAHGAIVEVDGRGFHQCAEWLGDDRAARDARKNALYTLWGYRVLRLPESVVRDGTGKALLHRFLEVAT